MHSVNYNYEGRSMLDFILMSDIKFEAGQHLWIEKGGTITVMSCHFCNH